MTAPAGPADIRCVVFKCSSVDNYGTSGPNARPATETHLLIDKVYCRSSSWQVCSECSEQSKDHDLHTIRNDTNRWSVWYGRLVRPDATDPDGLEAIVAVEVMLHRIWWLLTGAAPP